MRVRRAAAPTPGVISITVTVNEPANHRITTGALTDPETTDLLRPGPAGITPA